MRPFLISAVAALLCAVPSQAATQHHTWRTLTVAQKRAVVERVIVRGEHAERWWLKHRDRFYLLPASPRAAPMCPALGIQAPVRVCDRARLARHARLVLAQLESTLTETGDWETAVTIVQRVYPGSAWWLLSCSSSEGGHGQWEWRGGAPYDAAPPDTQAPGGWMQYFPGTFWSDFDAAVVDLRARGFHVPRTAFSWTSPLGQAVAAGWAYSHARPPGKWTGGGC